jgi:hypothetical protein
MKHHQLGLVGSIALSLVSLVSREALAVKITATTSQPGRVEGQSVTVTAAVDWEDPFAPVNPIVRTTRVVSATLQAPGITASPAPTTSINMVLDSATGLYTGAFPDLPFGTYTATILATKTVRDPTTGTIVTPIIPVVTKASAQRGVQVAQPPGCFNFGQSLQGFTANGFFDFNTQQIAVAQSFNPQVSPVGFGGPNGSFFLNLTGAQIPTSNQVNGFYRFDVISPDLTGNANWQGINGVSFRVEETNMGLRFHAVVRVFHADGTPGVFTQPDPTNSLLVVASPDFPNTFNTVVERFQLAQGDRVIGVDVRGYGSPGTAPPNVLVDSICPRH